MVAEDFIVEVVSVLNREIDKNSIHEKPYLVHE